MLSRCQSIRWSGRGISNGRQRLSGAPSHRQLSSTTLRIAQSSSRPLRQPRNTPFISTLQQSRSLSLFGWGSSGPADATPASSPSASSTTNVPKQDEGFSVKASHSTSDSPDPTNILSPTPMGDHEPEILSKLEDRISLPSDFDPSSFEHFSAEAERIGYLREVCGLDFGWGTSTLMQSFVEYFHIYTGQTWTVSIMGVAILVRLSLIKFTLDAQKLAARMREIQPILAPLREKYTATISSGDRASAMKIAAEIRAVSREANVGVFPLIKPILFQIPLQFGGFRSIRAAAVLPVPAFETESFLWHTNLALSDPFIIPVLGAGLTYLTFSKSMSSNSNPSATNATFQKIMKYALPFASLLFLHWQAAAVQVFFLASTTFTYVQTNLLANDSFRSLIKLPPLRPHTTAVEALGGLNTRQKPQVVDTTARAVQPSRPRPSRGSSMTKISVVDKVVNGVKSKWRQFRSIGKKKHDKRQRERAVEEYEFRERQTLELQREQRNQETSDAIERKKKTYRNDVTEVGSTGMKVRKKETQTRQ